MRQLACTQRVKANAAMSQMSDIANPVTEPPKKTPTKRERQQRERPPRKGRDQETTIAQPTCVCGFTLHIRYQVRQLAEEDVGCNMR